MATRTATLTDAQKAFIRDNPYVGVVTTLRSDGSPHSTPVWVDVEDGALLFNTETGRAKPRHLRRDPRVALVVVDPSDPYRWVSVSGTAETTLEGAEEHIDKLAKKYLGKDEYPWHNPEESRVLVRIRPERVDASGFE